MARSQEFDEAVVPLVSSDDLDLLYELHEVLEAHGVRASVLGDPVAGWAVARLPTSERRRPCIIVRRSDLPYARWLAWRTGVDFTPEADEQGGQGESSSGEAVLARSHQR
jgi:hypothetical protein